MSDDPTPPDIPPVTLVVQDTYQGQSVQDASDQHDEED